MAAQSQDIQITSAEENRAARLDLLAREKELTRLRDAVAAERQRLPWVRLDKIMSSTARRAGSGCAICSEAAVS